VIGLLRHGEVEGGNCFRGSTDDPLTALGLDQMQHAITEDQTWDRVITSPLQRCSRFAETVAQQRSIPFDIDPRLAEILSQLGESQNEVVRGTVQQALLWRRMSPEGNS
jgi:alpha-ribazole phosphatase